MANFGPKQVIRQPCTASSGEPFCLCGVYIGVINVSFAGVWRLLLACVVAAMVFFGLWASMREECTLSSIENLLFFNGSIVRRWLGRPKESS